MILSSIRLKTRLAFPPGRLGHELLPVVAVVATATVAITYLVAGGILTGQDAATQFYPWYGYLGERLRAGHIPAWNPFQFAGAPFAADPQSGWMYVPAMVLFALLPLTAAVIAFFAAHLTLAGFGTYVLARLLGIDRMGAVIAATAYIGTGVMLGRMPCCPASYEIVSWVPVTLVGVDLAVRSRDTRGRVAGWALTGFALSQVLSAWLGQGAYYVLLLTGAYLTYRILIYPPSGTPGSWTWRRRLALLVLHGAIILAIGFGLAAAGLLPRLEYNAVSNVAGGVYEGSGAGEAQIGGSSSEDVLGRLFRPSLYYPGTVTLVLALAAIVTGRRRSAVPFLLGLAGITTVLSIPATTPLHQLFYLLPRFEDLHNHWPERVILVAYIAPALLAGLTVSTLREWHSARRVMAMAILPLALVGALAALGAVLPVAALLALGSTTLLLVIGAMPHGAALRRAIPAMILIILIADIAVSTRGLARDAPFGGYHRLDLSSYYAPTGAGAFLQSRQAEETDPFRFAGYNPAIQVAEDGQPVLYRYHFAEPATRLLLVNNRATALGLEDVQGYNPVQVARYVDYVTVMNGEQQEYHGANVFPRALDSPLLDLLNLRYLVVPAVLPSDRPDLLALVDRWDVVYRDEAVRVLRNPEALPRGWIVHEARRMDREESLDALAGGTFDPRRTALVEGPLPPLEQPADAGADRVEIVHGGHPDRLVARTRTDAAGLLVLSEVAYPAWQATVDGEPVSLVTVNGLFRGVPVPAGDHLVELRFVSGAMRAGLAISLATGGVVMVALVAAWWSRRGGGPILIKRS